MEREQLMRVAGRPKPWAWQAAQLVEKYGEVTWRPGVRRAATECDVWLRGDGN